MRPMSFDRRLGPILIGTAALVVPLGAQEAPAPATPIVSSDIALSRDGAELRLELVDGGRLDLVLDGDGAVRMNGERIGSYERRDELDAAWRQLLQEAMDAPAASLSGLLVDWSAPRGASAVARRLDRELEEAIRSAREQMPARDAPAAGNAPVAVSDASDSIQRLNERLREMERLIEDPEALRGLQQLQRLETLESLEALEHLDIPALRELRREVEKNVRSEVRDEVRDEVRAEMRDRGWMEQMTSPWRHVVRGLAGVFSTLMAYAVLVGLGFLAVFFGRSYLEGIADTARHQTLRSGLVGLAGSFLVLPAYILGLLALAISIVGIPLILVFAPLFPVAVVLAALGGYLAVAHGAGEALAERRFTGNDWFTRANSYYYVITGVGLLLVLFLVGHIVMMAGPWLGFLEGLLKFMAVMLTWIAFTIGFGAFLISRGGTRPLGELPEASLEEEPTHV